MLFLKMSVLHQWNAAVTHVAACRLPVQCLTVVSVALLSTIPTSPTWLNCRVETRQRCSQCTVCIEFATSSRRLLMDLPNIQLHTGNANAANASTSTEHVETSCVTRRVLTRRQSWPSFQFCSQLNLINSQHVQFSIVWPSPSWTSCELMTQLDSWVASAVRIGL